MLASSVIYAAKKRKKPLQKVPKLPPPEGAKSNPSKRHRDRLNTQLEKLTSLLPFTEEVRACLDKLSVLRLGVGYLKVKSFLNATLRNSQNGSCMTSPDVHNALLSSTGTSQVSSLDGVSFSEGDLLLQALNGFVLVVTTEGYVFYASPTIQDFLGFHQSDVIHQSVFELIHTNDRALFRRQLHFAFNPHSSQRDGLAEGGDDQSSSEVSTNLRTYNPQVIPPENSSFLERNFCCRFRCLLDNSSGFVAINFCGRLKFLHGQNRVSELGERVAPQLALFAIAIPVEPPSILEIRTKTVMFQTKHKLDFTPMAIDSRGKVFLGYSEAELCIKGSGYNFIHAADMMYCADNHVRMIKTGESGFTVFRLLTKNATWLWVQANARLILKEGKPDFIVARQRVLTNEEGEEHVRLHRLQQSFSLTTGEALLYDRAPTVDMPDTCSPAKQRKLDEYSVRPNSLQSCIVNQGQTVYCQHKSASTLNTLNDDAFKDTHATIGVRGDFWQHPSPKAAVESMIKSEDAIQDMMETLQQILGDGNLAETVDVSADELKSWERTLLKVRNNSCDLADDLNDVIVDDVLLYVEEQLQKEAALKLPERLDTRVPTLNFQSQAFACQGSVQNLSWAQDPLDQLLASSGQVSEEPPVGMVERTLIDLPQMNSSGLNLPVAEPIFDPRFVDSCAETQKLSSVQVSFMDNNQGVFWHKQSCQIYPNQMVQPNGHLSTEHRTQRQPGFSLQYGQRNSNHVNTQNVPNGSVIAADPAASSCMESRFVLPGQDPQNLRQSWQLEQPPRPQLISNGPTGISRLADFPPNPPVAYSSMTSFPVEQGIMGPPVTTSSVFRINPPFVPPNVRLIPQRLKHSSGHISGPSCFNQDDGNESLFNLDMAPFSHQMAPNSVNPGNLPMQQQPCFNLGNQLISPSVIANGGMAFPHCATGTSAPHRANGNIN
ncbi:aryl hydrocarbon receptor 2 [Syngnathus typhle]